MDIRTFSSRGYNLWETSDTIVDLDSTYAIWDGNAVGDTWPDWISTGFGIEDGSAAYESGNGLLITGAVVGDSILLHNTDYTEININNYTFLAFWLNVRDWVDNQDITFSLYSTINKSSTYLSLSTYFNFDKLQQWQRIMVPLERLNIRQSTELIGSPTYVNELEFILQPGIDFWLDNISLVVGEWRDLSIGPPVVSEIVFEGDIIPVMSPFSDS